MAKIQRPTIPSAGEDVEELERPHRARGMPGFGNGLGRCFEKLSLHLRHDPAALRLDIYPDETKASVRAKPSAQMLTQPDLEQPGASSSPNVHSELSR